MTINRKWNTAVPAILSGLLLCGCGDDKPAADLPPPPGGGYSAPAPAAALPDPAAPAPVASDPLLTPDPLLKSGTPTGDDPLNGPAMPTDHSHWLRGRVQGARVTVRLNGAREGEYLGYIDKDITMKLRAGVNTVSFEYTPQRSDASAKIDLVESEHTPPIPPLAAFQSVPAPSGDAPLVPATQTFTFFAK